MNITLTKEQNDKVNNGESITIFSPATEATVTHYGGGISFQSGPHEPQELLTVSLPPTINFNSNEQKRC
tara:strand:+ start:311 stop:517 length:207 start_codon:yes stop_codon:yes gene_type:complete